MRFYRHPELMEALRSKVDKDLKFVHVIRNPYDVLSTMTRRSPSKTLEINIELFFKLCAGIAKLKRRLQPSQLFELRLESFIEQPKPHLTGLCAFLGVETNERYLEDCASIVFKSPKKSRFDIPWDANSISQVRERMEAFSFLSGYGFEVNGPHP